MSLPIEVVREACEIGENAARRYIYSKIDPKFLKNIEICVVYENFSFTVDAFIDVLPMENIDIEKIVEEASDIALSEIDKFIRGKLLCLTS